VSFGLLTATNIEDVAPILRRVAKGYRGAQGGRYPAIWSIIADEVEAFATHLEAVVAEAKTIHPERPRYRERL